MKFLLRLKLFKDALGVFKRNKNYTIKHFVFIGIKRNTSVKDCHLLSSSERFRFLRTLDLSDNDFLDLAGVVGALTALQNLLSLNLEGNPCSVCTSYKDVVLQVLPRLLYLDNVELLEEDKKIVDASTTDHAVLIFTCHRITGLRAPPKEKKTKQTIHVEVTLPLLEELDLAELEPPPVEDEPQELVPPTPPTPSAPPTSPSESKGNSSKRSKSTSDKKSLSSKTSGKASSKSKGGKSSKSKEPGPYDAPDEHEREARLHLRNASFRTERVTWAKIMQFPEEAVVVETSESDLVKVRDTFRSRIEVKVVYMKTMMPTKEKKRKGGKGKGGKKKDKGGKGKEKGGKGKEKGGDKKSKGKSTKSEEETVVEPKVEEVVEKPPEEIILKKVTLAKFYCDLHNINWSDKTIDFYWAQHYEVGANAVAVEGSLRAVEYGEGGKGGGGKGKKKGRKKGKEKEASEVTDDTTVAGTAKQKLPSYMTVQVGFGLRRSHFPAAQVDLQEQQQLVK